MASRILGMGDVVTMVEKAQSVVDEQEATRLAQKMVTRARTHTHAHTRVRICICISV